MAKVVGPLHSTEARGSVGSLTYNTWRGTRTVKTRGGPAGPAAGARLAMLQLGKAASFNWSELTDAQRARWNQYGIDHQESQWTGTPKRLSGHSWYVRIWVRMTLLGETPILTPPTVQPSRTPFFTLVDYAAGEWDIEWNWSPNHGYNPDYIEVYRAGPVSAGRTLTLHDAVRWFSAPLIDAIIFITETPAPGHYTLFARTVTDQGLVGPWVISQKTL